VLVCQLSVASLFVSFEMIEHRLCFKTVKGVVKAAVYSKHFVLSINKNKTSIFTALFSRKSILGTFMESGAGRASKVRGVASIKSHNSFATVKEIKHYCD